MAIYRGDQATVGWGREATYGTVQAATSGSFGVMEAFNAPDPKLDLKFHRIVGNGRDLMFQLEGKNVVETGISFIPQDFELLEYAFGTRITSGAAGTYSLGSGKTWVYTGANDGTIPSMTIETTYSPGQTSFPRAFAGIKVDKLTITAEEEGEVKFDMDLKGQRQTIAADAAPVPKVYTNNPFLFHNGSMSMFGTTFGKVTAFELSLANNLKPKFYIASGTISAKFAGDMIEGVRDYEIGTTIIAQDRLVWNELTSGTVSGFTTTLRLATASHAVDIVCQNCVISEAPHNVPEDKAEVSVEIKMRPRYVTVYEHYPPSQGY